MLKKNSDKQKFNNILRLIRKDAHKGLECFYNEYGRLIYYAAKNVGCSTEKANVVVNTVLIKIWQKVGQITNIENPKAWVFTVAKNCAKDELNEIWHLELKEEICVSDNDFQEIIDKNGFEYLISPLKNDEKDIFVLKFVERCTFKDIAICFGKPVPTITTIFYRAIEKIKKFLKKEKTE